jgi:hypothetical protein
MPAWYRFKSFLRINIIISRHHARYNANAIPKTTQIIRDTNIVFPLLANYLAAAQLLLFAISARTLLTLFAGTEKEGTLLAPILSFVPTAIAVIIAPNDLAIGVAESSYLDLTISLIFRLVIIISLV